MSSELAAAGMFVPPQTAGTVLCCICGVAIPPNPANMCVRCLRSRVDIAEGLPRHASVVHCPDCRSFLHPPSTWVRAELESKELLAFLLRCLRPLLSRLVRLVGAEFIWTEPNSRRLKLRLRVQREALVVAVLDQAHVVEFTVHDHLCPACAYGEASPDQWVAAVHLRQHVPHRRTLVYIKQLVLRQGAAARAVRVAEADGGGLDFFFDRRSDAAKLVDFLSGVAPVRSGSDKQLVSLDPRWNICGYKHTFSVEICPVCREDLICLPLKVSQSLGNLGPLVLCTKVTSSMVLLDPFNLRSVFLDANQYWGAPFTALLTSRQLVKYIVLDIEPESSEVTVGGSNYTLAHAQVARVSVLGKNDNIFAVKTHLGHLLGRGDYALGYDLYGADRNDLEIDEYKNLVLPDAILVKKTYERKRRKKHGKARPGKLKSLNVETDSTSKIRVEEENRNAEHEEFLRDLEENHELGVNILLYRNQDYQPSEMASTADGDEVPSVLLDESLADLELSDEEGSGGGTDAMQP